MEQLSLISEVIISAVLMLIIIVLGVMMHKSGKPYKASISLIHKIASVLLVVLLVYIFMGNQGELEVNLFLLVLLVMAFVSTVALFISGAFLSTKETSPTMVWLHRIGSVGLVISLLLAFYFIMVN